MTNSEFESIFKQHYTQLCRYACLLVKDKEVAEDIIQDLFIYLWENKHELSIHSNEAYLFKAVKNRAINYLKSFWNAGRQEFTQINENAMVTNGISEWIDQKDLERIIREALEQLPERCHAVFYLKRIEDFSYKEIAQKLSITEKTVENQMTIAIRKIADYLDKNWK